MKTPHQIKDSLAYREMERCRRVIQNLENRIERNFSRGICEVNSGDINPKDEEWVFKDLQNAGYTITEEEIVVGPYNYKKRFINWEVPNE